MTTEAQVTLEQMRTGDQWSKDGDYNWLQVFQYGKPDPAVPGMQIATTPFLLADVKVVYGAVAGDNDGPAWVAFGKLKDGRFFSIRASCDYTGWG